MNDIYLLLGSNTGNRTHYLAEAETNIKTQIGPVVKTSHIYESEPWGFEADTFFLNKVIEIQTDYPPETLLYHLQDIEKQIGRSTKTATFYSSRIIDIDILFYSDRTIHKPDLTIPHPHLHKRKFTLIPLAEIAGDFIHPVLQASIHNLLSQCTDQGMVQRYHS